MTMISATILTRNSAKYIEKVLQSLESFDEIVIYDNGSTDETLLIASRFKNVSIHKGTFIGFGATHNIASALAKFDWIFSIDSDEVVSKELVQEIKSLLLHPDRVYSVPRVNFFNGKQIKGCGWWPDRQLRLYHRGWTRFNDAQVHEKIQLEDVREVQLTSPLLHYSYSNISDFLTKMQHYSDLFAKQYVGKRRSSLLLALWHGIGGFLRSYFLKLGIRDGREGVIISAYNAHTSFYKYLKLQEANEKFYDQSTPRF